MKGEVYHVKFIINPNKGDSTRGIVFGRSFLRTSKGIVDLGKGVMTIYPDLDPFYDNSGSLDDRGDEWDDQLENIDFGDIPEIDEVPPFMCNMGKNSRNKIKIKRNYKMTYGDEGPSLSTKQLLTNETDQDKLERDIYERVLMIQESRPIIEMLKNSEQHKKLFDSILLEKLKLDEEIEEGEEEAAKEVIRNYKTLREKNDQRAFVIPIRVKGKYDTHALIDIGSNINVYIQIGAGEVKAIEDKIQMLDHSIVKPMGILRDVLCQVDVSTILAMFLVLNIPVDKDVPIVMGRSFIYTCGGIINTITRTTPTFNGICHQQFLVATIKAKTEEENKDSEKEIFESRDKEGKPIYEPNSLENDSFVSKPLDTLNTIRKFCIWKKMVAVLGSLPVPLQNNNWMTKYAESSYRNVKRDRTWNFKCSIVDPEGNEYNNGCNKATKSKYYTKLNALLHKQVYAPSIVYWRLLNKMGCGEEIEEMLEIKVIKIGGDEEMFTSEA
nr:hypothetical protein [Tanacetum cinerariifolium]